MLSGRRWPCVGSSGCGRFAGGRGGHKIAGATVFKGIEGFGSRKEIHVVKVFSWSPNLPIVIEVVDSNENIERILPLIRPMLKKGLFTSARVEYEFHVPAKR